jgi:hypothetical protein
MSPSVDIKCEYVCVQMILLEESASSVVVLCKSCNVVLSEWFLFSYKIISVLQKYVHKLYKVAVTNTIDSPLPGLT